MKYFSLLFILLSSYVSAGSHSHEVLDDLQLKIADLQHALHITQVEMRILEDQVKNQELARNHITTRQQPRIDQMSQFLSNLDKKVTQLEKVQEAISIDMRNLNNNLSQATATIHELNEKNRTLEDRLLVSHDRLNDLSKLQPTIHSISKAIELNKNRSEPKNYRVKMGDSLAKIAKAHETTVAILKELNRLDDDRIFIDQELRLP